MQKNIPMLRFPEFKDEWEEKYLSNIVEYRNGGSFENNVVENGKYKLITLNSLDINGDLKKNHKTVKFADWYLEKDDLVMVLSDVAHGNFLGLVDIVPESNKFVLNQRMGLLRKNDSDTNLQFLRYYINKNQKYFKKHGQGSSQQNLTKGDILKFIIPKPTLPEQQKISSFLSKVDDWLENLKNQKENLEKYKKGMMQRIFSQKIRFKDKNGKRFSDWEEKNLGEVATFSKGEGLSKEDIIHSGKYECIHYGELFTKYKERVENIFSRTNKQFSKLSGENDMLMPTSDVTPRGLATATALSKAGIILGGDILIIRSQVINNLFLSYYIRANKKAIMRLVNGVTVYHIYASDLAKLVVSFPNVEEQQKIAEFLTSIDKVIASKQKQIDLAESWKKGLMQRMFI